MSLNTLYGGGRIGPSAYDVYVELATIAGDPVLSKAQWLASLEGEAAWLIDPDHDAWEDDYLFPARSVVRHEGSLYFAPASTLGVEPGTNADVWVLLASGIDPVLSEQIVSDAEDARDGAVAAQGAAEDARDAALAAAAAAGTFPTRAAGLAAVAESGYFWSPDGAPSGFSALWRDVAGSAVDQTIYHPLKGVFDAEAAARVAGDAALDAAKVTKVDLPPETGWRLAFLLESLILQGIRNNGHFWARMADDAVVPPSAFLRDLPLESGWLAALVAAGVIPFGVRRDGSTWARLAADAEVPAAALVRDMPLESGWLAAMLVGDVIPFGLRRDGSTWAKLASDAIVPQSAITDLFPSSAIACWGDSLTEGAGGGGTTYPGVLATLTGRQVYNGGVGGDESSDVLTRFSAAPALLPRTSIICAGRNNYADREQVRDDILAMVDQLPARVNGFLVLGVTNGNYASERLGGVGYNQIVQLNETLAHTFGNSFLDWRRYVIDFGLAEAGITPTAQDLIDIADDIVPDSLRPDNIHGTSVYYTLKANFVARALTARRM